MLNAPPRRLHVEVPAAHSATAEKFYPKKTLSITASEKKHNFFADAKLY